MNRTHLRRIVALEERFAPPMPDWSHLNIDELHDLKMLLVRGFIAQRKRTGSQLPLPSWITEALDCESPKQRAAARVAAGLNPVLPTVYGKPRLAPDRKQSDAVDRKRAVQPLPTLPDSLNEPSDQLPWTAKTVANRRRRVRGKRRPRRASRG
jgi:hypothetical protein